MPEKLTAAEVDKLLSRILSGTQKSTRTDQEPPLPVGAPVRSGSGSPGEDLIYGYGFRIQLRLNLSAQEHLRVLARRLQTRLKTPETADAHYLEREVMSAVGDVLTGSRESRGLGEDLLKLVEDRFARSVTMVPVAGPDLSGLTSPVALGERVLLGRLEASAEAAFAAFAAKHVGRPIHFTDDVWWTEDLLGYRRDPEAFDEGPPHSEIALFAVCIDSVDVGAAIRAREQVEALLGAMWLLDQRSERLACAPPWVLGGPSRSEVPREPDLDPDGVLRLDLLQVSSRVAPTGAITFPVRAPAVDVAGVLALRPGVVDLVARSETPASEQALARRLAAACRLGWIAGQDVSADIEVLHLVVALESLVGDHGPSRGVTSRFVSRVLALQSPERRDRAKLDALYDMRSEVGHQGFSAGSRTRLSKAAAFGLETLLECTVLFADNVTRHRFRSEADLLGWLDQNSPDANDPFA